MNGHEIMTSDKAHYATVGYLLLNNAMPTVKDLLAKMGHGALAVIPAEVKAPTAAPLPGWAGGTGQAAPVPQVQVAPNISGFQMLEQTIGEVTSRGKTVLFKLAKPIKDGTCPWPQTTGHGGHFPTVEELIGMGKTKAYRYFTNSGWPKYSIGSTSFYMQADGGESFRGRPIQPFEWRGWNGRFQDDARYFRPDEMREYLLTTGISNADIDARFKEAGVQEVKAQPTGMQPPVDGTAAQPRTRGRRAQRAR